MEGEVCEQEREGRHRDDSPADAEEDPGRPGEAADGERERTAGGGSADEAEHAGTVPRVARDRNPMRGDQGNAGERETERRVR